MRAEILAEYLRAARDAWQQLPPDDPRNLHQYLADALLEDQLIRDGQPTEEPCD